MRHVLNCTFLPKTLVTPTAGGVDLNLAQPCQRPQPMTRKRKKSNRHKKPRKKNRKVDVTPSEPEKSFAELIDGFIPRATGVQSSATTTWSRLTQSPHMNRTQCSSFCVSLHRRHRGLLDSGMASDPRAELTDVSAGLVDSLMRLRIHRNARTRGEN